MATDFNGSESVALGSNPGNSTLGGTLAASATDGIAVFANLNLNKAASGYALTVASGLLTPATSTAIAVGSAQPRSWSSLSSLRRPFQRAVQYRLTVVAEDANQNVATDFTGTITAAFAANFGGSLLTGTLGGTLTTNAVAGVGSFDGLTLNMPGKGYTLQLTAVGLSSVFTNPLDVPTVLTIDGTSDSTTASVSRLQARRSST